MLGLADILNKTIRLIPLCCSLMVMPCVHAEDAVPAQGFTVQDVSTELDEDVYLMDAQIKYQFSAAAIEALDSGVPLTIELDIEVFQPRKWMWDDKIAGLKQRYRIAYHALTQQYVVTNLNSGAQSSYQNRNVAIHMMGNIRRLPILDRRLVKEDEHYMARMRASLVINELPAPLRTWAYLASEWRLSSEWYEWPLT